MTQTTGTLNIPSLAEPLVVPNRTIAQAWYMFIRALWQRSGGATGGGTVTSGMTFPFAGTVAPTGFLVCDGSAVSRGTFSALFTAIGTTWGDGDGSTTFNLPDTRGRVILGAGGTYSPGDTGGSSTLSLGVANLPPHNHNIIDPGHNHTSLVAASNVTSGSSAGGATSGNTGTSSTGVSTDNTGLGTPANILPPYAAMLMIIKT